jgi:hypothetical protein
VRRFLAVMHDDLGPVLSTHTTKVHNLIALPLLPGVFGGLGLLGALANIGKEGEAKAAGLAAMLIGSAAMVALSIWLVRWRIRRSKRTFTIHGTGLGIHEAAGTQHAYRWNQIAARIRRFKGSAAELELTLPERKLTLKGEHITDVYGMFERIDGGIASAQYATLVQQIEQGHTVVIGNMRLDATGIALGDKHIEWKVAEVAAYSVDGYIIKDRDHGFLKSMIKSVFVHWEPNMQLVHHLATTFEQRARVSSTTAGSAPRA